MVVTEDRWPERDFRRQPLLRDGPLVMLARLNGVLILTSIICDLAYAAQNSDRAAAPRRHHNVVVVRRK